MNNNTPLDNNDVVFFGNDTFKVIHLKSMLESNIRNKWNKGTYNHITQKPDGYVDSLMRSISIVNTSIYVTEFKYKLRRECEILKIGGHNSIRFS